MPKCKRGKKIMFCIKKPKQLFSFLVIVLFTVNYKIFTNLLKFEITWHQRDLKQLLNWRKHSHLILLYNYLMCIGILWQLSVWPKRADARYWFIYMYTCVILEKHCFIPVWNKISQNIWEYFWTFQINKPEFEQWFCV